MPWSVRTMHIVIIQEGEKRTAAILIDPVQHSFIDCGATLADAFFPDHLEVFNFAKTDVDQQHSEAIMVEDQGRDLPAQDRSREHVNGGEVFEVGESTAQPQ